MLNMPDVGMVFANRDAVMLDMQRHLAGMHDVLGADVPDKMRRYMIFSSDVANGMMRCGLSGRNGQASCDGE
ncbi:MAG TPA: hypothetical protein VFN42_07860 [Acetobacteraceae bacterium]|nr:hypothetical protein [Acetobacteraceae bacterium]